MMKNGLNLLALVSVSVAPTLLGVVRVDAQILYEQGLEDLYNPAGFGADGRWDGPLLVADMADSSIFRGVDFSLDGAGPIEITQVVVYGTNADELDIRFWEDGLGTPGPGIVANLAASSVVESTAVGSNQNLTEIHRLVVDLAQPVMLDANTTYWLTAGGLNVSDATWAWQTRPTIEGEIALRNQGGGWFPFTTAVDGLGNVNVEFAFAVIPAPGTAMMLGLGGMFVSRRRR